MDHRNFVESLPVEQRRHLTEKSDRKGLLALSVHWGAIFCVGGLIRVHSPFWPLLMVVQGVLLVFLFTALHETIHRTAFKTPWINEGVARLHGFMIFLPPEWFRYFHFAHHRHTQNPEKDPELATSKPDNWVQYLWYVSGLPVWWSQGRTLLRNAAGRCHSDFVPASAHPKIRKEAQIMLAGYASLLLGSFIIGADWLLYVWILPLLFGQPFLRLYLLAEHGRCPFVANMFENSRTTFTNRLIRRLAWNMPYHAEHHAFPAVPFHRLPALHELTQTRLSVTENGYARFHRSYISTLK
jgi:fatty acid desaturase